MNDSPTIEPTTITLEPPWWRCENGNEFRCGHNKPKHCPVCGSSKIEMVVDVAPEFTQPKQDRK